MSKGSVPSASTALELKRPLPNGRPNAPWSLAALSRAISLKLTWSVAPLPLSKAVKSKPLMVASCVVLQGTNIQRFGLVAEA